MPTTHQLKPMVSMKLSAAEWLPEIPLLHGCPKMSTWGHPELLIGGWNDIKCHSAPFQIKTCPDSSRREMAPKYFKKKSIAFSFFWTPTTFYKGSLSLPRCLASLPSVLQSPVTHRWLGGPFRFILCVTQAKEALFLFLQGLHVGTRCWLSMWLEERKEAVPWHIFCDCWCLSHVGRRNRGPCFPESSPGCS